MNRTQIEGTGAGRGSFKSYAVGFALSIVLTAIAFGLVMSDAVSGRIASPGIVMAAVAQMLVHMHYFLHLDTSSAARWNLLALLFTLLIIIIFVGGSLWIMANLNYRMM